MPIAIFKRNCALLRNSAQCYCVQNFTRGRVPAHICTVLSLRFQELPERGAWICLNIVFFGTHQCNKSLTDNLEYVIAVCVCVWKVWASLYRKHHSANLQQMGHCTNETPCIWFWQRRRRAVQCFSYLQGLFLSCKKWGGATVFVANTSGLTPLFDASWHLSHEMCFYIRLALRHKHLATVHRTLRPHNRKQLHAEGNAGLGAQPSHK